MILDEKWFCRKVIMYVNPQPRASPRPQQFQPWMEITSMEIREWMEIPSIENKGLFFMENLSFHTMLFIVFCQWRVTSEPQAPDFWQWMAITCMEIWEWIEITSIDRPESFFPSRIILSIHLPRGPGQEPNQKLQLYMIFVQDILPKILHTHY